MGMLPPPLSNYWGAWPPLPPPPSYAYAKTTEANLMKLHRKIEHNEKVCCAQELGSYAQGQGHNQVKGQIVPKIVLLINY